MRPLSQHCKELAPNQHFESYRQEEVGEKAADVFGDLLDILQRGYKVIGDLLRRQREIEFLFMKKNYYFYCLMHSASSLVDVSVIDHPQNKLCKMEYY